MKPLLLLSTLHRNHAAHSGYQALAEHLPAARFLHTTRQDPPHHPRKFLAQVARKFAFSRWYLGSCAELERMAWKEVHAGYTGIVHFLWADHDMGYLDLALDLAPDLASNAARHRLVGSFHNCDDTFVHTIRYPARLRKFAAVILMSETQRRFFENAGVPAERIHVVRHGVDTRHFQPATPAPGDFTVLAAGGYRRNFPLLREVCGLLRDAPGLRVDIIGPVAFKEQFDRLPNARYRTGLSDAEYLDAMRTSSCLLQTVENATANNVILEAMACGLPVVAERMGGIPEYIDETCSMLAPGGDARAIASALLALRDDPARRSALARGARARAESLDWENVARDMEAIYEQL